MKLIPKGKVITYKTLGKIFNLHPRYIAKTLSENKNQDVYPCYKVVNSDGSVGGYNLGVEEKVKRLELDGIKVLDNKILNFDVVNRHPRLFNFFVAFPLEGKELDKFFNLYEDLNKINNYSFTIQKVDSPHITLRFFGELSFKEFYKIVNKTKKNIANIKTNLKNQIVKFNQIGNFNNNIWFYKSKSENINREFKKFYVQYHKAIGWNIEKRPYKPHLTVLRVKNEIKFFEIGDKIKFILENYDFSIKINKLRFYAAVDNFYQIKLLDIEL